MRKLFLDDVREVEWIYEGPMAEGFEVVRSYSEFIDYIKAKGLPDFISFDNDLGLDESGEVASEGYAAAKWLVYESGLDLRDLRFYEEGGGVVYFFPILFLKVYIGKYLFTFLVAFQTGRDHIFCHPFQNSSDLRSPLAEAQPPCLFLGFPLSGAGVSCLLSILTASLKLQ